MKNLRRFALLLLLGASLAGCTQIPYGWKQEMELAPRIPSSIARSLENETGLGPSAWVDGLRADLHNYDLLGSTWAGLLSDIYRLTTP